MSARLRNGDSFYRHQRGGDVYSLGRLGQVFFFDSLVNIVFEQQVDLHVSGSSVIEYRLLVSVLVLVNVMIQ
jgi:tetrahydromethanopterin S-methyltransferase subunit E